jgi:hypothetical protein
MASGANAGIVLVVISATVANRNRTTSDTAAQIDPQCPDENRVEMP